MARGWESKSVEAQIESANSRHIGPNVTMTPDQIRRQNEIESIQLSRTRVMHDIATAKNPKYRATLEAALAFLDEKIKTLG